MGNYLQITMLYGALRKSCQVSNGTIEKYDPDLNTKRQLPLLMVDKLMITGLSSIASVYMWPMFMWRDLACLEIQLDKSKEPDLYDVYKKHRSYYDHICS